MKTEDFQRMICNASRAVQRLNRRLAIEIPYPHETDHHRQLPHPEPEPAVRDEPPGTNAGKETGAPRAVVRLRSYRTRLLDPDNLCPKSLIDGLRRSFLIPGDRPQDIELTVTQEKVARRSQERTEIELDLPD